jgi:hypothetical protein
MHPWGNATPHRFSLLGCAVTPRANSILAFEDTGQQLLKNIAMRSGVHLRIMAPLSDWCDEAALVHDGHNIIREVVIERASTQ